MSSRNSFDTKKFNFLIAGKLKPNSEPGTYLVNANGIYEILDSILWRRGCNRFLFDFNSHELYFTSSGSSELSKGLYQTGELPKVLEVKKLFDSPVTAYSNYKGNIIFLAPPPVRDLYLTTDQTPKQRRLTFSPKRLEQSPVFLTGNQIAYSVHDFKKFGNCDTIAKLDLENLNESIIWQSDEAAAGGISASPDGKWLAFIKKHFKYKREQYSLALINTSNHEQTDLKDLVVWASSFKWSPDGKYLTFVGNETVRQCQEGKLNLYFFASSGWKLDGVIENITEFAWSEDSKHLLVTSKEGSAEQMKIIDKSGFMRKTFKMGFYNISEICSVSGRFANHVLDTEGLK